MQPTSTSYNYQSNSTNRDSRFPTIHNGKTKTAIVVPSTRAIQRTQSFDWRKSKLLGDELTWTRTIIQLTRILYTPGWWTGNAWHHILSIHACDALHNARMAAWCLFMITRTALDWYQVPLLQTKIRKCVVLRVQVNNIGNVWTYNVTIERVRVRVKVDAMETQQCVLCVLLSYTLLSIT